MNNRISHFQCIVPPHMLKEISQRGSALQKQLALKTLGASEQFRSLRQLFADVAALAAPVAATQKQRIIYNAGNTSNLPGQSVRTEGATPTGDACVDEAYDGSGATYDLFKDLYSRNSIDDQGMRMDSTVHYEVGYDNAFWNGQQMVYGDGDENLPESERLFNRFTIAIDIIGHELTHGITQYEARLIYWGQPGALNESFSDVFGSLVKQRMLTQSASQADWLIGAGLFTSNVNGQGIRSMKAPGTAYDDPVLGKDPQPGHMRDYKNVAYDNGGVHINSGIPNRAFYIVAQEIGGLAWEKAGQIWYVTLRDKLQVSSSFQDAANFTYETTGELFGKDSLEQKAVRKGWSEVGINIGGTGCLLGPLGMLRR
ncbi:M4 family metallopeptidase [Chloroflexota bacterium]